MQINLTEAAGLLAFMPASLAAAKAGSRARRGRGDWAVIAVINAVLTIEIVLSWRHRLGLLIGNRLRLDGLYDERRPAQLAMLLVLIVLAALVARTIVRRAPTRRLALARAATSAVVTLFLIETVSFHRIDRVLYGSLGPMMLIGWLWLACGWTTTAAALARRR